MEKPQHRLCCSIVAYEDEETWHSKAKRWFWKQCCYGTSRHPQLTQWAREGFPPAHQQVVRSRTGVLPTCPIIIKTTSKPTLMELPKRVLKYWCRGDNQIYMTLSLWSICATCFHEICDDKVPSFISCLMPWNIAVQKCQHFFFFFGGGGGFGIWEPPPPLLCWGKNRKWSHIFCMRAYLKCQS